MKIEQVLKYNKELEMQINGSTEFSNLGLASSDEVFLLTYCDSLKSLNDAISKKNVIAAFVKKEDVVDIKANISFIFSDRPVIDFFLFHNYLIKNTDFYRKDRHAHISTSANIHPTAFIAEKNVEISENVTVCPKAVIMENTIIKPGVYIGPGTVIGIDGTQTINYGERKYFRILHAGGVLIGKNTFVGANSSLVRSLFRKYTTIGKNVTVGNLVNIGHGCRIDDDVLILPNSIVCGSTIVEKGARISPGAVISSSKKIGKNARITLGAVVTKDVENGGRVSGNFAIEHKKLLNHIKKISR